MVPAEAPPTRVSGEAIPRFENPRTATAREMAEWHAKYRVWAQPLKVAYTPVQKSVTSNSWTAADVAACSRLADATAKVVDRDELFQSPDPRVNVQLHKAIEALHQLGIACSHTDVTTARGAAARADSLLSQTAYLLREYDLDL
jgi:hypothetical protein